MELTRKTPTTVTLTLPFGEWENVLAVAETGVALAHQSAERRGGMPDDIREMSDSTERFVELVLDSLSAQYGKDEVEALLSTEEGD